jgi:hypothetical protein
MKGVLKYFETYEEIAYEGAWVVKTQSEKPHNNIFKLCEKSLTWVKENGPSNGMDVEFTVFCDCHYDEETNIVKHGLVARLNNI